MATEFLLGTEQLDDRGMVMDCSNIKLYLKQWIDDHVDHKMILHKNNTMVPVLQAEGEPLFLMDQNPTAENIAKRLFEQAATMGFPILEATLWESPTSCAVCSQP